CQLFARAVRITPNRLPVHRVVGGRDDVGPVLEESALSTIAARDPRRGTRGPAARTSPSARSARPPRWGPSAPGLRAAASGPLVLLPLQRIERPELRTRHLGTEFVRVRADLGLWYLCPVTGTYLVPASTL